MEGHVEEASALQTSTKLVVAVTGAFLTGFIPQGPIPEIVERRGAIQQALAMRGEDWLTGAFSEAPGGTYFSGGGFAQEIPLVVATRRGAGFTHRAQELLTDRASTDEHFAKLIGSGWAISLVSVAIDVYEFGVAVLNGLLHIDTPAGSSLRESADAIKQLVWLKPVIEGEPLPALSAMFGLLAEETVGHLQLADFENETARKEGPAAVLDAAGDDLGHLLWLHPVMQLRVLEHNQLDNAESLAGPFQTTVDIRDGRFVPGIGSSAIVEFGQAHQAPSILRLIERHWAIFAFYMLTDRKLLLMLDELRWSTPTKLSAFEEDAHRVFDLFSAVLHVRARIDSTLAALGGDEQELWNRIALVQNFEALVQGVDRKIALLGSIAERRVQEATAASARRTTRILSSLTALSMVTVTVAVLGAILGSHTATYDDVLLRIGVIFVAFILGVAILIAAFSYRPRRPAEPRRTRGRKQGGTAR